MNHRGHETKLSMENILNILEDQKSQKRVEMNDFSNDFDSGLQISCVDTEDEFDQSDAYAKWSEYLKIALLLALFGIKNVVRPE